MPYLVPPAMPIGFPIDQPVVTADDLVLRPFTRDDVPGVVEAYTDPDIQRWNLRSLNPSEAAEWIDASSRSWRDGTGGMWAVTSAASGALLGRVSIRGVDPQSGYAEVGYWVLPSARGKGVAPRACVALSDWAFGYLHRLELCHSVHNGPSCRVAEKAGFVLEGTLRSALKHADGWHDMHLHARVAV
jgi:ribosomal-protein-alanine N-acetyltransferase